MTSTEDAEAMVVSRRQLLGEDDALDAALATAGAGIWRFDTAAGRLVLSERMQLLLGAARPTGRPEPATFEGALAGAERRRLAAAIAAALRSDGCLALDVQVLRLDGGTRWLQIAGTVVRDPAHGGISGVGIALDIDERKRVEQRLSVRDAVARIIATAESLDQAVPQILRAIARGVDMDVCSLWLPDADGKVLTCSYSHIAGPDEVRFEAFSQQTLRSRYMFGEGLPGRVWESREAVWVESFAAEPSAARVAAAITDGLSSCVALPLVAGSHFVGVIDVFTSRPTPADDELLETLAGLGQKLGQFILRMRAESELRQSDTHQGLLVSILQAQRDSEDPDEAMRATAEMLGQRLAVMRVGFVEIKGDEFTLLPSWVGAGAEPLRGTRPLSYLDKVVREEANGGRMVTIADVGTDARVTGSRLLDIGARSALTVPVMRRKRWQASVYVHDASPRQWTRAEQRLVRDVAEHTWDTVERLRARAARRESQALARIISDNSTQALVLTDQSGYVRYANAACLELTGFEGEDIRERPLHDLIHHHYPDGRPFPISECPIDSAMQVREVVRDHEAVFFRKDGSAFPVICSASPIVRAGQLATIIEIRDVSASRSAALALAHSEKRFRGTFENAAMGVAHVALDGRWLRVNRRLCEIVGYDEAVLLKKRFQDITHPDDLESDLTLVQRMLRREIETYTLEKRYVRGDGGIVWVELTVSLSLDDQDEPEYFIAIVSDVSARKQAESRMRTALAVKEEFLGLVSHELRTPMTVILGMSEILASDSVEPDSRRSIAADIVASAHDLNELIESMLVLARLDRDDEDIHEPIVLGRVAADSVGRQQSRDTARHYTLSDPGGAIVDANPGLIDQVITNLLVNASKYSAAGGDVRVVIDSDSTEVSLHVIDAGPGLSDEQLDQVFEPFYRAPGSAGAPGAGLGLAVASRIVESLGGRIWAARRDGGSDFGFALPRLKHDEE